MEVVVTHPSADFDGLASAVAARRLYPGSTLALVGQASPSVRAFLGLHADELEVVDAARLDPAAVTRLIACEVADLDRLGPLGAAVRERDVPVVVLDHHADAGEAAGEAAVRSTDGALTTTLVFMLAGRGIEPTQLEATLFALGIHEDTGSLTFATATERDAEALAWCLRHGARQQSLARYLRQPLGDEERAVLDALLGSLEPVGDGDEVRLAAVDWPRYVEGVSVLADRLVELVDCGALVCLVAHGERTICVVRSHGGTLDAAALARAVGGGGHPEAASATLHQGLVEARAAVLAALPAALRGGVRARALMSSPARAVAEETTVAAALATCQRHGQSAILVGVPEAPSGLVTREDLDRALAHGLGHAPVKAVTGPLRETVGVDAPLAVVTRAVAHAAGGYVPVLEDGLVVGVVTRRDVLAARGERPARRGGAAEPLDLGPRLLSLPGLAAVFEAVQAVAGRFAGVYLVGGAVRDLLLGGDALDVDLAVEGDGIAFARALAELLRGRVVPHEAFGTAVVVHAEGRLDVASTRTEYYEAPAALPDVERAPIRQDLLRRDFTVNAMAVALHGTAFGHLVDPFGGRADLEARTLRVLHSLSFVDDPTRIFRGVRYEARYGFRLDPATERLARSCVEMGLVGAVSPARVRNELLPLLAEDAAARAIARLGSLGLAPALHPRLAADEQTARLVERLDALRLRHAPHLPAWRLRLAALARGIEAEALVDWLAGLRLRRRDADRIADAVVAAPRLLALLADTSAPADAVAAIAPHDPDGALLALALAPEGSARAWLERYLAELREVELEIDGRDIAGLGVRESPRVGEILAEVRRRKLNGELVDRDAELAAARALIGAR